MGTSGQTDLALSEHGYLSNEMMERVGVRIYMEANIMGVIQVPRGRVGFGAYETPERHIDGYETPEREGSSKRINPSLYLYLNNLKSS
jgi:hypothetical protein